MSHELSSRLAAAGETSVLTRRQAARLCQTSVFLGGAAAAVGRIAATAGDLSPDLRTFCSAGHLGKHQGQS